MKVTQPIKNICLVLLIIQAAIALGCATKARNPVPADQISKVEILGTPGIRAWAGKINPEFQQDFIDAVRIKNEVYYPVQKPGCAVSDDLLALSGGGSNGAFSAGFLNGWTRAGTRPKFKTVTGVSTGALIAPFAFLGPEYDETLKSIYTGISTEDIAKNRGISALWNESLADVTPLINLVNTYVDESMLTAISEEHAKGGRLYIGTTHMDAGRFVIWNMGAIASSGYPDALRLFREVLLASSSMPVFFPPVLINVEVDGNQYDEMHSDGGVMAQVFFYQFTLDIAEVDKNLNLPKEFKCVEIFVMRNGKIEPDFKEVERNLIKIAGRTISIMVKASGMNDLVRIYHLAKQGHIGFNYVAVPDEFVYTADELFDREEMNRLFQLGYNLASSNYEWSKELPWGK
ncbi:patatin-like phospholipase family protein [Desulfobacterota bacterium AH_259_B03_O07]|nr:patatin-like phospholipase family protein [Desulfobacterota bacterium AH_259_B03_O07]